MDITSGFVGAFFGACASYLTYNASCKNTYASLISSNRLQWINSFRDEVGVIVSALRMLPENERAVRDSGNKENDEFYKKLRMEAEQARSKLLTRLRISEREVDKYNAVLTEILEKIDFTSPLDQTETINNIQLRTKKILEPEWVKVKREAGGHGWNPKK